MVPEGWKKIALADVTKEKISYGIVQAGPHIENGIPYIKSSDVGGNIDISALQKTSSDIHYKYRRSSVHPGDIVFSLRGNIGERSIVPDDIAEANLTQGTARISINKLNNRDFIYYQISSSYFLKVVNALSKGSTFKEISLEELRKVKILLAPLSEQTKIARILSTWDKAIETTEKLLTNSQQQKKALMQQLLTGKKRLKGFDGEWKEYRLKGLFSERVEMNRTDLSLLSITREGGVVQRNDVGRKDTSSEDKSKYLRICPGDIGYNTMRMWQGVSALSDKEGIVSPAYTILIPNDNAAPIYMSYLFKSPQMIHKFYRHSQGLVSDTWNLKFRHFSEIKISIPDITEQRCIGALLKNCDCQIEKLKNKLFMLHQEKKALMQVLLTGKKRVKV